MVSGECVSKDIPAAFASSAIPPECPAPALPCGDAIVPALGGVVPSTCSEALSVRLDARHAHMCCPQMNATTGTISQADTLGFTGHDGPSRTAKSSNRQPACKQAHPRSGIRRPPPGLRAAPHGPASHRRTSGKKRWSRDRPSARSCTDVVTCQVSLHEFAVVKEQVGR